MKEANETGLGFELWGHLHPREPLFQVCGIMIRANLSSDRREEAEMKRKEQLRLSQKMKGESCLFLTSLCPHGETCISRVAAKS